MSEIQGLGQVQGVNEEGDSCSHQVTPTCYLAHGMSALGDGGQVRRQKNVIVFLEREREE